jgi:uncharacterized protein (DUF488 family)
MMTIGHSNRPLDELIGMLRAHGVDLLVDVRTVPKSRYNPQFNTDSLPVPLRAAGIAYLHMPGLGGLRHPRKDSINTGWRNDSFRGYADYMQTPEFDAALGELLQVSDGRQAAVMCAEAVPWRCHRSMIADALAARGVAVEHIMSAVKRNPHKMTSFARVEGTRVTYPAETLELF